VVISSTERSTAISTTRRRRTAPIAEIVVQASLIAASALFVSVLGTAAAALSTEVIAFAASILLGAVALTDSDDRTRCVAAAVGGYTGVELLVRAADVEEQGGAQAMSGGVAVLGVVGLLVLAVRGPSDFRVDRLVGVGALVVLLCGTAGLVVTGLGGGLELPAGLVSAIELVAWSGAGAVGALLLLGGSIVRSPLLRRCGLGFATVGVANAVRIIDGPSQLVGMFELAAAGMFLFAAMPVVFARLVRVKRPKPYGSQFRSSLPSESAMRAV
jgi:two-component system, OmpR family, sensor kinase